MQVLPTAYALSLRPGASISGSTAAPNAILMVTNTNTSSGYAVRAEGARTGVYGVTEGGSISDYGVHGSASNGASYGVYGNKAGDAGGLGVHGRNDSGSGTGVSGYHGAAGTGTLGYSAAYNGVGGATGRLDSNWGLYTADNCHASGYTMLSAVTQVVQNGDTENLERGDVVVICGMGRSPAEGVPPLIQVRKARQANSTGVLGVVASSYAAEWLFPPEKVDPTGATGLGKAIPLSGPGPIAPGEYLLVVVQGPGQVKVDAVAGAIRPGDLLSSAGTAGHATRAATVTIEGVRTVVPGTILGKALEPLDAGRKLIYVYVTLQ